MTEQQFLIALIVPTLVPTITVLVGILVNNARIGDLNGRFGDLRVHVDKRIDDLTRLMDANTKGIMDKLDSIDRRVTDLEQGRRAR